MKKIRIFSALCAFLVLSASLSSCGAKPASTPTSGNASQAAGEEAPYEANVLGITFTGEPIADDATTKRELERITNSKINFTWVSNSNYEDKLNVMMASNSLPTIVVLNGLTASIVANARAGAFWDITDELKNYENLSQTNPITLDNVSIDGRVYGVPRTRLLGRMGITYRKDWLANVNMEEPKTIDDLYDVLYAFTYNDPDGNGKDDTYGMTWCKFNGPLDIIATWFGAGNQWIEKEDGTVEPYFVSEKFMDSMDFAKKLYDEGLVNEDFAVRDSAIWGDDFIASKSGMHIDVADAAQRYDAELSKNGVKDAVWVINTVEGPAGRVNLPTNGNGGIVAISKNGAKTEEDMRKALEFLDKTNTEEAMNLFYYGMPGEHFNIDAEGKVVRVEGAADITASKNEGFNQFMTGVLENQTQEHFSAIRAQVWDVQTVQNPPIIVANPCLSAMASSKVYSEKGSTLDKLWQDARINYIVGQIDKDGYNKIIEQWYAQGGQELIEELSAMNKANK